MGREPRRDTYRRDPAEFLTERRFPEYKAAKSAPLPGLRTPGLDPRKRADVMETAAAYRAELKQLPLPELLEKAAEEEDRMDAVQRLVLQSKEDRAWYGKTANADFDYWSKAELWSIDEGVALILGKDPRIVTWKKVQPIVQAVSLARQFADVRDLASRAVSVGKLGAYNTPSAFLQWAHSAAGAVSEDLWHAVSARSDAVQTMEEVMKQRDALLARNSELEAIENSPARSFNESDPDYPQELHIAYLAWSCMEADYAGNDTPKTRLLAWLEANYPELNSEKKKRIATVANWDQSPGRRKGPGK